MAFSLFYYTVQYLNIIYTLFGKTIIEYLLRKHGFMQYQDKTVF